MTKANAKVRVNMDISYVQLNIWKFEAEKLEKALYCNFYESTELSPNFVEYKYNHYNE